MRGKKKKFIRNIQRFFLNCFAYHPRHSTLERQVENTEGKTKIFTEVNLGEILQKYKTDTTRW